MRMEHATTTSIPSPSTQPEESALGGEIRASDEIGMMHDGTNIFADQEPWISEDRPRRLNIHAPQQDTRMIT